MNGTVQSAVDSRQRPTFLQVLAGEPSDAEIEERYLALARMLLASEDGNKAA